MNPRDLPYDIYSAQSIEAHAELLLNKCLRDVVEAPHSVVYKGKGSLGQLVEQLHFHYTPNSNSEPDFPEAGVELKTSPLKRDSKGRLRSKERMVLNIIDYATEHQTEFRNSSFWRKNSKLLLMFFLHEQEKLPLDYIFKLIRLWDFPATDLKIIKDDWEKIAEKIRAGKAHELSEGDTLYLGACTKGANRESIRKQPFSDIPAKQRAYSLKQKYVNYIIEALAQKPVTRPTAKPLLKKVEKPATEPIIKSLGDYEAGETFEENVIKRFRPYYGKTVEEILKRLHLSESNAKSKYHLLCKGILGVKGKEIEEFEKADVEMKTIRLDAKGTPCEAMSFKQIKYMEILDEEWEESYWFQTVSRRFFFVVFQERGDELVLKKVMFWGMPAQDIDEAERFWEEIREHIRQDDYKNFRKISDDRIFHVRPKGRDRFDLMPTPSGREERKMAYWINASYIKDIVSG